jgi:hypothetical protein
MPRGDPNRQALTHKMANNAASEKSGSSEYRHNPVCHGCRLRELNARWPLLANAYWREPLILPGGTMGPV